MDSADRLRPEEAAFPWGDRRPNGGESDERDRLGTASEREAFAALEANSEIPNKTERTEASGAELLDAVHAFLCRFVAYPSSDAAVAHTLWIAHTHLMDEWESTPRIAFLSPEPGSGKTRALEITETMVPRPVASVNATPAYLFRKVSDEAGRPTVLYDEIDTLFGPKARDNEEVRGLINAGHRRGATAGRCVVRGKTIDTEELPAYCAVALAGLGNLPDTIITRSVVIPMRRRSPTESIESYRHRAHAPAGNRLRDLLAIWCGSLKGIGERWPELPEGITDRAADLWEPLIAIADAAGGGWPSRARVAAVTLVTLAMAGTPSLGVRLLSDLRVVFGDRDAMATDQILIDLAKLDEAPWGDLRGKPITSRVLANLLKPYDVRPKVVRVGVTTHRGYAREDLHDPWIRYVPPPSRQNVTHVTSDTLDLGVPAREHVTHVTSETEPTPADLYRAARDGE